MIIDYQVSIELVKKSQKIIFVMNEIVQNTLLSNRQFIVVANL